MAATQKILAKTTGLYFNSLAYLNPNKVKKDGLKLFCTPFARKVKPHHQAFLATGLAEILVVNGNKIQTYKWGNGAKKVLLVHGWASHSFRWKSYIETLIKNDFTVFALDAPAHGNSDGKILNIVIYEKVIAAVLTQNIDIEAIISHSFGSVASILHLSKQPNPNIKKIVLMASPGKVKEFFDFWQQYLGLSSKAIKLISGQFEIELNNKIEYFVAANFAKNFTIPALIIHDKLDKTTNPNDSVTLNKAWKGSKLILTEGLGHELKGQELLNEIIDFIK